MARETVVVYKTITDKEKWFEMSYIYGNVTAFWELT